MIQNQQEEVQSLLGSLFRLRDTVHLYHLSTRSYSNHIVSQEFYEKLLDVIDKIAETWQGENKTILDIKIKPTQTVNDIYDTLVKMQDFITSKKQAFSISIQSIIDDLLNLISITIYKIKYLN